MKEQNKKDDNFKLIIQNKKNDDANKSSKRPTYLSFQGEIMLSTGNQIWA